tara:strand:- start:743 stop:982 length:240 start_codon:yes stop_codon:yes gene_type:complete
MRVPNSSSQDPIFTFENKRYELNKMPKDVVELVKHINIANSQLKIQEDKLKLLLLGRQTMTTQLKERLKDQIFLDNLGS